MPITPIMPTLEEDGLEFAEEPFFVGTPLTWTNGRSHNTRDHNLHSQTGISSIGNMQSTSTIIDFETPGDAFIKPEWNDEDSDDAFGPTLGIRPRLHGGAIQSTLSSGKTSGLSTHEFSSSQTPASQKRRGRPASRTTATQIRNTAARTASIPQAVRTRGRQYQRRRAPYARDPDHIPSPEFGPLGLINGRYNVAGARHQPGYSIILCIEQASIWGDFDFLEHRGVFCITEIPRRSSAERFHFQWRGEIVQGSEPLYGPECVGWLEFHGDGDIKGGVSIHGDALLFRGERIDQIGTRSPREAKSMRKEWKSYVQAVAEEEESWEQRDGCEWRGVSRKGTR